MEGPGPVRLWVNGVEPALSSLCVIFTLLKSGVCRCIMQKWKEEPCHVVYHRRKDFCLVAVKIGRPIVKCISVSDITILSSSSLEEKTAIRVLVWFLSNTQEWHRKKDGEIELFGAQILLYSHTSRDGKKRNGGCIQCDIFIRHRKTQLSFDFKWK